VTEIRVLIADDHAVVRRGLRVFLELHDDIAVVGEAPDGASCVELAESAKPDVILMDLKMPGVDGVSATRTLRATSATTPRILVITSFTDAASVVPAIRAGANGCVYKDVDPAALANAIRSVYAGHVVLPPDVAAALMAGEVGTDRMSHLTARERDVLDELAHGRSNREIAKALRLAEKTVKTHVSSILMKLEVEDRTQAALYAVRHTGSSGSSEGSSGSSGQDQG
jgi:DNA-binding NarL/FixJ family response regulator